MYHFQKSKQILNKGIFNYFDLDENQKSNVRYLIKGTRQLKWMSIIYIHI